MHGGALVAAGVPPDVLTPDRLGEVFEIGVDRLGGLTISYQGLATVSGLPAAR